MMGIAARGDEKNYGQEISGVLARPASASNVTRSKEMCLLCIARIDLRGPPKRKFVSSVSKKRCVAAS